MTDRIAIATVEAGPSLDGTPHQFDIVAETSRGARYILRGLFVDEAATDYLAAKVRAFGSIDPDKWTEFYPVYGSDAWADEDAEAQPYRVAVQAGFMHEDDVPEAFQAIL
jgi:hypothetical protein